MRRSLVSVGLTAALFGCHTPKYDLSAEHPEEFVVPPSEPRFDNPPQSGYRRPPPKREVTPGPGMGGPPGIGGGMGPGGF